MCEKKQVSARLNLQAGKGLHEFWQSLGIVFEGYETAKSKLPSRTPRNSFSERGPGSRGIERVGPGRRARACATLRWKGPQFPVILLMLMLRRELIVHSSYCLAFCQVLRHQPCFRVILVLGQDGGLLQARRRRDIGRLAATQSHQP